jgi:hypothetical protein
MICGCESSQHRPGNSRAHAPKYSCNSHSAPFFAALEQFWQSLLQRGEDDLYTGYVIRSNPLFPCHLSLNHNFLQTVRPISDPLG